MKTLFTAVASLLGLRAKASPDAPPSLGGDEDSRSLDAELARIDPAITAKQLLERFQAKQVSGRAFQRLAYSRAVDAEWLKQKLRQAIDLADWHLACDLLPFVNNAASSDLNPILGQALRASFDHIVAEHPAAVWGTPELILDSLAENDPRVIPDLVHVCRLPPNAPAGWYLDYRKAVDFIQRTTALPAAARISALQGILGASEVDEYVQEAINTLQSSTSREV